MIVDRKNKNEILCRDEIRLLAAIGFMAARKGLHHEASDIFESLIRNRPTKSFGYVGLALASLFIGNSEQAISVLRSRGLVKIPDDTELKAWLAISLQLSGEMDSAHALVRHLEVPYIDCSTLNLLDIYFAKK